MSLRTLYQRFCSLPIYVRSLIVATAGILLLICLAKPELVNSAVHLLQAFPLVLVLPVGRGQPPKGEESEQTVEQKQSSLL